MRLPTIIAIASLALSPCAFAQTNVATLEDRLKSIDASNLAEADCNLQIASANKANAADLIYGGRLCAAVEKPLEASFLLLVGQLRATSDILLMPPATQADDRSLMPLYGMLYYGGGLNGVDDDVLHDPVRRARLFELLDRWSPFYSPTYDPGWNVRKRPDANLYATTIARAKADLGKNLDRVVRLDSDDQYYALQRQYNELLARIPKSDGLKAGTSDYKLFDNLQVRMRERGIAMGVDMGPPPPDPKELAARRESTDSPADSPPPAPEKGEVIIFSHVDSTIDKCTDQAERMAVSEGGKIGRKQVYTSAKWGTIFRADITGGQFGPQRFTCTESFTGMQPFEFGKLQPLPR